MENDEVDRPLLWNLPSNMNNIPSRLLPPQRMQQQVGQVVRGVIPGAGPQHQYHPNPYLQHIYTRHASREDNTNQNYNDGASLEDHLQEVISHSVNGSNGDSPGSPLEGGMAADGHGHGSLGRLQNQQIDWKVFMGSFAFSIILLLRLMADHILGLLVFFGLSLAFHYANTRMIEIVHITSLRERQHSVKVLFQCLWLIAFLLAQIAGIYLFFDDQQLWHVLCYRLPSTWQGTLIDLLWVTMVTDYIIRFGTIILKCLVSVTPQMCMAQKRKGKCYMLIEILSQWYRTLLPIVPWLHFLYDQPKSGKLVFSAILAVIYMIIKGWRIVMDAYSVFKAYKTFRTDMKFGIEPTVEEIKSRGESCPICQDDYQDPVMLSCKHIFCENCVSIWFDREKTCPMCRAEIQADSPVWQDGSTSIHLQWY